MSGKQLEDHIKIVGILYIVMSALNILGSIIIWGIMSGVGLFTSKGGFFLLWGLGSLISGYLIILALPGLIGGIALLKRKSWSRNLILILAFLNLPNAPLGTILGIYSIWIFLVEKEWYYYFD